MSITTLPNPDRRDEHDAMQARRRGGSKGSNEPPLEVNNGELKAQTTDFQLLANSGGMETNFECCSF